MNTINEIPSTCLMQATRSASRAITSRYEEALKPVSLTASQFSTLAALANTGEVPLSNLAAGLGMDRTTLNKVIGPLARRGLVKSLASAEDKRQRLLKLTKQGSELLESALPLWQGVQQKTRKVLGNQEASELLNLLKRISSS